MIRWFKFSSNIQIREGRVTDCAQLANLHKQGFERNWSVPEFENLICDPSIRSHLAQTRLKRPVGFIMSRLAADEAEILSIVVAKKARRKGVAVKLLTTHISSLVQCGAKSLFLEVDELNSAAIALYQQFGFQKVGLRKAYYQREDGSTPAALVMKRELK
jgi:[ribosomal protein S18]-alanine N-acetyltransferase